MVKDTIIVVRRIWENKNKTVGNMMQATNS
jgi:hypothetical protein